MIKESLHSDQFAWKDLRILLSGAPAVTIQSFNLTRSTNRIPVRTHSRYIQFYKVGNVTYSGELSMLHSSFQSLVLPGLDFTDAPFIINATFQSDNTFKNYSVIGCHFVNWNINYNQGDPNGLITLPFVAKQCIAI